MAPERRLRRILAPGRPSIFAAVDDALIVGPFGMEGFSKKLSEIASAPIDGLLAHPGVLTGTSYPLDAPPVIANVSASLKGANHVLKGQVISVERAVSLGADAIACHINVGNPFDLEMMRMLGRVAEECARLGFPLLAIVYPRTSEGGTDNNFEHEAVHDKAAYLARLYQCAQIARDLGAHVVKTHMLQDAVLMRAFVEEFSPLQIVFSGGPLVDLSDFLSRCEVVSRAGAAGISIGRNFFMRPDPGAAIRAARNVLDGAS